MNIECNNIKDFCELINISIGQDLKNITIFVSFDTSYPPLAVPTTPKDHKKFTFILFTPLYTAIYSGNIKQDIFTAEYNMLKDICSNRSIYIHTFDKLKFDKDKNILSLDTHIDVT